METSIAPSRAQKSELRPSATTYHRLVAIQRWFPAWLRYGLDPYNTVADRFVAGAAGQLPPRSLVLDAGAGECRHEPLFRHTRYVSTDSGVGDAQAWDYSKLSFGSDLRALPLREGALDAVLSVNVLEHVAEPQRVLAEYHRVLRPGGALYLVAPQSWRLHQAPHDYFRFTRYALEHLLREVGLEVEQLEPVGGAFWNLGSRSLYLLTHIRGAAFLGALALAPVLGFLVPLACFYLDRFDRAREDTLGHTVIARKSLSRR
jgi:SAM-dependent methyltransferase